MKRFDEIMALTLHVADTPAGQALPWDTVIRDLSVLLERERQEASVFSQKDMESCRFAVYAWVDETLLNSRRPDAAHWAACSLQQRFFKTSAAGIGFYTRLREQLENLRSTLGTGDETAEAAQLLTLENPAKRAAPFLPPVKPQPTPAGTAYVEPSATAVTEQELPGLLQRAASYRGLSAEGEGTLHVLGAYARCLVYGFRGQYFRPDQEPLLREFRTAGLAILTRLREDSVGHESTIHRRSEHKRRSPGFRVLSAGDEQPRAHESVRTAFEALEPFLHIVLPVACCLGFYLYCAALLASLNLPI